MPSDGRCPTRGRAPTSRRVSIQMFEVERSQSSHGPLVDGLANKVPVVTVYFWIIKILTTGMGEAASDALVRAGGVVAVGATAVALVASFVAQFRVTRYIPGVYWLAVVMVSVFGTMAADIPHFLGVPVWAT